MSHLQIDISFDDSNEDLRLFTHCVSSFLEQLRLKPFVEASFVVVAAAVAVVAEVEALAADDADEDAMDEKDWCLDERRPVLSRAVVD